MPVNDPIGDMITRIRNAHMRGRSTCKTPKSTMRVRVLDVLVSEGYIRGYSDIVIDGFPGLEIELKYFDGAPVIEKIQRVSKPGRRVYSAVKDIPLVRNGLGIAVLSTPKGVMSDSVARAENVGGEILCQVY
jgi:small subunit ribosomal protein S8